MGNKPKYRGFCYSEFNPRDFEQHFAARETIERFKGCESMKDLMTDQISGYMADFFGPDKLEDVEMERLPANAELWYFMYELVPETEAAVDAQ